MSSSANTPPAAKKKVLLSTGAAPFKYEIIDVVFAHAVMQAPPFRSLNAADVCRKANEILSHAATELGANGVLWIRYDLRPEATGMEVHASGTAVKLL